MSLRRKFAAKAGSFARRRRRNDHGRSIARETCVRRTCCNGIRELLRTFARAFDPYRPELHYMRGPGPKWYAKRAALAAQTSGPVDAHPGTGAVAARA